MKRLCTLLFISLLVPQAFADVTAIIVAEPTSRKEGLIVSRDGMERHLAKALGESVKVTYSEDLTDAMRATRSGGYDVFIAPPQVAASALGHGYELVGSTDDDEAYLLVASAKVGSFNDLRHQQIYLPQQDSIYTYLARGLLNANGLSFADLRHVEYARYPQAGLVALMIGNSEATVVREADWQSWQQSHAGLAKVLAVSREVPGGFSLAMKKSLPADTRDKLARWFEAEAPTCGMKPIKARADAARYKRVAELGTFTPTSLPGATVVTLATMKQLASQGAVVVDTRIESEYRDKHIPGALWLPYGEKSLKDVAFDARVDDFPGLATLDRTQQIIFHCNGPECWKSYKASRAAVAAGYPHVYWFRGGMPEWEGAGERVEHATGALALAR